MIVKNGEKDMDQLLYECENKEKGKEVVKEGTKEETKEEIPEEPSSDSSETLSEVPPEEFVENYIDIEELLLHSVTLRKNKRAVELLSSESLVFVKGKVGIRYSTDETDAFITGYLSDLMFFAVRIMVLAEKIQKLANIDDNAKIKCKD